MIDPREWGNLNVSHESLDVGAQEAALRFFSQNKKNNPSNQHQARTGHPRANRGEQRLLAESRPVAQLAQDSYLGMALKNVGRSEPSRIHRDEEDGSSPSSDPESTEEQQTSTTGEESDASSEHSRGHRRRRDNRHGRN